MKTIISAISSGVKGSTPLEVVQQVAINQPRGYSRVDSIGLALVTIEPHNRKLSLDLAGV